MAEFVTYTPACYQAVCDFLTELNRDEKNHINWNCMISCGFCGRDLTTAQTERHLNGKTKRISQSSGCVRISTLI
jgi:hypothetical protein